MCLPLKHMVARHMGLLGFVHVPLFHRKVGPQAIT